MNHHIWSNLKIKSSRCIHVTTRHWHHHNTTLMYACCGLCSMMHSLNHWIWFIHSTQKKTTQNSLTDTVGKIKKKKKVTTTTAQLSSGQIQLLYRKHTHYKTEILKLNKTNKQHKQILSYNNSNNNKLYIHTYIQILLSYIYIYIYMYMSHTLHALYVSSLCDTIWPKCVKCNI